MGLEGESEQGESRQCDLRDADEEEDKTLTARFRTHASSRGKRRERGTRFQTRCERGFLGRSRRDAIRKRARRGEARRTRDDEPPAKSSPPMRNDHPLAFQVQHAIGQ